MVIEGAGHTIFGGVSIADSVGIEVRNLVTSQSLNIATSLTSRDITIHHVKFGGLFSAGVNNPLKNLAVRDSSFICSCAQSSSDDGTTSNSCIEITSEIYGQTISPFYFERNFVESDCVKNMKVRARALAGGQSPVKHVIEDNYFHSLRNQLGDEVSNVTWRNSPGGAASADRNIFARNTLISEGHATGLYLRDDMDNVNLSNNCFDIKNPLGRGVFLGGIGTASGNLDTTFSSGLQFNGNKVLISGGAALNFQAIDENPLAANNGNIISNNVFATRGADPAVAVGGGSAGARWDHNTFYAGSSDVQAVVFDGSFVSDSVQFTSNIFACSRNADAGARRDCLKLSFDKAKYSGNNNLFFNFAAPLVQVYAPSNGYQVNLSVWKEQEAEDLTSAEGNPQFVNRSNFDFHLSANSSARGIGANGSDAGALPFSTDTLAPSAPTGVSLGN